MTTNQNQHHVQPRPEQPMEPKPKLQQTGVRVKLIGADGNAFALIGLVRQALREAGYGEDFVRAFMDDAVSGDYQHLLAVIADTVEIE
jgi:hypothetical protein